MTENSQYESKEIELLQNFEKELKEKIQPTITKIYQKVKLDYFGIDCNIDNVFNLIIFEVNANMNILTNSSNNLISKKPILIIKNAVEKMLLEKGN